MKKSERQALIKKVIEESPVETQDELLEKLQASGVKATQATISRDMRELNIVKGRTLNEGNHYIILEQAPQELEKLAEVVPDAVERISTVQFMVIIQTYLGLANVLAAVIDDLQFPEVAGTLAGANTLAIITHSETEAIAIEKLINSYL